MTDPSYKIGLAGITKVILVVGRDCGKIGKRILMIKERLYYAMKESSRSISQLIIFFFSFKNYN